jgi:hypothetical protein
MPWIKVIRESEADGDLKEAYEKMRAVNRSYETAWPNERPLDPQANPDTITPPMLASLNPKAMLHGRELMMQVMRGPSRLTPVQREMIATVTSITTDCRY